MKSLKRVLVVFMLSAFGIVGMAQETQPAAQQQNSNAAFVSHYYKTYLLAQRYGDSNNAINALYNVLAEYPQNDSLLYTLSFLYFQKGNNAQAVLVSQDLLKVKPGHLGALEICATGYENLGVKDKALDAYESLYLKSSDFQSLYKVAFLQYDLKRYTECQTNADILLKKTEADSLSVFFTDDNNEEKEFPIKVAIHNLKGLTSQAQGDKASAKKHFEAALAISPDFFVAKKNLEGLK